MRMAMSCARLRSSCTRMDDAGKRRSSREACLIDAMCQLPPPLPGARRFPQNKGSRMSDILLNSLQYYGAAAGAIAALIVSLDLGRKPTGWAFVIFVTSSIAL